MTFDLRYCLTGCGAGGKILFVVICLITPLLSLAVLYFDFPIPDELKGVIFYAQVNNLCHFGSVIGGRGELILEAFLLA